MLSRYIRQESIGASSKEKRPSFLTMLLPPTAFEIKPVATRRSGGMITKLGQKMVRKGTEIALALCTNAFELGTNG